VHPSGDVLVNPISPWWNRPPARYAVAILSVLIALLVTDRLGSPMRTMPTPLFFLAVIVSARLGGSKPGLLAAVLSILAIEYFFVPPLFSFAVEIDYLATFLAFAFSALFVASLSAAQQSAAKSLRAARDELDGRVRELRGSNEALQAEIAERRRAEASLRDSETRLRALVGSIDEIVIEFDADGTYLNIWTQNEKLLSRPASELVGRRVAQLMGAATARKYIEAIRRVLASGQAESLEYSLQMTQGECWFLARISPIPSTDGSRRTVSFLARDITERKRGERHLATQFAIARALADADTIAAATPPLLRLVGESIEAGWGTLWIFDRDAGPVRRQHSWHSEALGAAESDAIGADTDLLPDRGWPGLGWQDAQPRWIADTAPEADFHRMPAAAKAGLRAAIIVPVLLAGEPLGILQFFSRAAGQPDEEELTTLSAIGSQIGQFIKRSRAEAELKQQERQHRLTIDTLPALVWRTRPDGSADFFNQPCLDYTGLSLDQALGWGWTDAVHPDDVGGMMERGRAIRLSGVRGDAEARLRHVDGGYRWFLFRAEPLRDEAGRIVKWYGTTTDIDDRKRAEDALRESERRFRDYTETASDWHWETGPDHRFTRVPDGLANLGIDVGRRIGTRRWDFATDVEEEPEKWRRHVAALEARQPFRGFTFRTMFPPSNSTVYISTSGKPIFDAAGNFVGYRGISSDVTAAVRADQAEEALQQARAELAHVARVTTLGELTASITHEINQPVGAVVINADAGLQWLAAEPPDLDEVRHALERIVKEGNRASQVIRRVHALVKKTPTLKDRLDINETIREVIALTQSEVHRHRIALETRLSSDLKCVLGDRIQLHQVILNLIINAIEAMSGDGEGPRNLEVISERDGADGVLVAVLDCGPGLVAGQLDRLFDAFYSTKPDGMGMGLAISRSIVEAHGGRLWATANVPKGAIFQFTLPAEGEEVLPSPQASERGSLFDG
jgi:PAS domain S-box-containing protein